ncbi:hypothetical protein [Pseudoalteromonas sp. MMG005]|uniref:hypothetical protein n=1 Tax=Pseudoalteromonas sp. MMG005 TaxID=2822682 RepID=UPI001B39E19D|nr:hypothetical protein [Pseudoalteromonas sp. MMG005]MBQ4846899.1 hypothetical protein [Pseudoalteromonas sp. MMG005]
MLRAYFLNILNMCLTTLNITQAKPVGNAGYRLGNERLNNQLSHELCNVIACAGAWQPDEPSQAAYSPPLPKDETRGG